MVNRIMILLLSLLLSVGLLYYNVQNAHREHDLQQRDIAVEALRVERSEVEKELTELEEELEEVIVGDGNFVLLFEELPQALYTDAMPVLAKYGYVGVMALSPQSYPGREGCITVEQFDKLLSMGWEACLYWPYTMELDAFLQQMSPILEDLKLERPSAIDVERGENQHLQDESLLKEGFHTVIHHGELGEVVARGDTLSLFYVGAAGWNSGDAIQALKKAMNYGGSVVLKITFSDSGSSAFQKETFDAMCSSLQAQEETLHPTDLLGLSENLSANPDNNYYLARKSYLEEELERYDREIDAVYQLDLDALKEKN